MVKFQSATATSRLRHLAVFAEFTHFEGVKRVTYTVILSPDCTRAYNIAGLVPGLGCLSNGR